MAAVSPLTRGAADGTLTLLAEANSAMNETDTVLLPLAMTRRSCTQTEQRVIFYPNVSFC